MAVSKHQKSTRNYIIDLRKRYEHDPERKTEKIARSRFLGGGKKTNSHLRLVVTAKFSYETAPEKDLRLFETCRKNDI